MKGSYGCSMITLYAPWRLTKIRKAKRKNNQHSGYCTVTRKDKDGNIIEQYSYFHKPKCL